jgi:hypothetical protein
MRLSNNIPPLVAPTIWRQVCKPKRNPNDECQKKPEAKNPKAVDALRAAGSVFGIRHSDF